MLYSHFSRNSLILAIGLLTLTQTACRKDKRPKGCEDIIVAGKLVKQCDGTFFYRTSGGATILVNLEETTITTGDEGYPNFKIEFWGGTGPSGMTPNFGHENLNGKHIKDKLLPTRSLIFPDGAKITISASGMETLTHTISIYDGNESHQFDVTTKTVKHSSLELTKSKELDNAEADGETATYTMDANGLEYFNIYHETSPGNKVNNRVLLGSLNRNVPTQIRDFYDDPRLMHT